MEISSEHIIFTNLIIFVELQKKSLIKELKYKPAQCLSATTRERLFCHLKDFGWEIGKLSKTRFEKVIIIKKEHSIIPEIWVCSSYTKYREAFSKYLLEYFSYQGRIPQNYHIDHSLPRLRFGKLYPDYFIRLFLIDREVNCSYGAVYEKELYGSESNEEPYGGFHTNLITILKVLGYSIPSKATNVIERKNWALTTSRKLENDGLGDWMLHYPGLLTLIYDGYKNLNIDKTIYSEYFTVKIYGKYD
jgi:hypothetical protein